MIIEGSNILSLDWEITDSPWRELLSLSLSSLKRLKHVRVKKELEISPGCLAGLTQTAILTCVFKVINKFRVDCEVFRVTNLLDVVTFYLPECLNDFPLASLFCNKKTKCFLFLF